MGEATGSATEEATPVVDLAGPRAAPSLYRGTQPPEPEWVAPQRERETGALTHPQQLHLHPRCPQRSRYY